MFNNSKTKKMKTKKFILNGLMVMVAASMILTSCKKKEDEDKDTQSASDNEESEFVSNDALNMADQAANGKNSFKNGDAVYAPMSCATVTRDTANSADADTVTIDFGSTNCQCNDGRYRRGIIMIIHQGKWWIANSYRTITFDNYYVNDRHIEGTHTVTYNGLNSANHANWSITATNMKITSPDGTKYHTWNSTRNREHSSNNSTPFNPFDDVYSITGSASGSNSNGVSYTANITNALKRHLDCKYFEAGTVELTPSNKPMRTLDFGTDGTCDNQATVTINNNTYTITLH